MANNRKPLPVEEQTLLLTSMLFARKHLDEIFSFLPEERQERMHGAKFRFLELEQNERVTQIILELRRLLLIKRDNIRWIHRSWIEEELDKEPAYLQSILRPEFGDKKAPESTADFTSKDISVNQIVQSFLKPFLSTPQKIAIFDPVLMRLQSLNRANQDQSIFNIGCFSLRALMSALKRRRFAAFIKRNFKTSLKADRAYAEMDDNPLAFAPYKTQFLKLIFSHKSRESSFEELGLDCGLLTMAFYLSAEKPRWHRMIELVLAKSYGLKLRAMLKDIKEIVEEQPPKMPLANLLIDAMEQTFV
jgi:hypothetical protein